MNDQQKRSGTAFYIALCCCVAVIGAVGYAGRYTAAKRNAEQTSQNASVSVVPHITPTPPPIVPATPLPTKEPEPSTAPKHTAEAVSAAAVVSAKEPEPSAVPDFSAPCGGRVIKEMSKDELEYNAVMGDWRSHNGVDISVSEGEKIKAVRSGTVTEVFSGVLGETVIVDCGDGFTVVYGCLSGTDRIGIGDKLETGDVIGEFGGTGGEEITQPHLHLEIIKDGECVDPRDHIEFGK